MAGKGDKFRPTKLKEYRENFDQIVWKKDKENVTKNKEPIKEKTKEESISYN